jgi:hypothetical protein
MRWKRERSNAIGLNQVIVALNAMNFGALTHIKTWASGEGWPWTDSSFTWACQALPFHAMRAGLP